MLVNYCYQSRGEVCEWLKQAVLKTAVPERVPGVRIPPSPPCTTFIFLYLHAFLSLILSVDEKEDRR